MEHYDDNAYEPDLEEKVDEIGQFLAHQAYEGEKREREDEWEQLYEDHPELATEDGAAPVAEAIDQLAERAGNPELRDDPRFARMVYEMMGGGKAEPSGEPEEESIFQRLWADRQRKTLNWDSR
jgi:hypothetical protein